MNGTLAWLTIATLRPAGSRAALEDAGVVTVTANELFDGVTAAW